MGDRLGSQNVKDQLKFVVGLYGILGLLIGIVTLLTANLIAIGAGAAGRFAGGIAAVGSAFSPLAVGALLSLFLAFHVEERMDDDADSEDVYLAVGVGNGVGYFVLGLLSILVGGINVLGTFFVGILLSTLIGGAIVGGVSVGFLYYRDWVDQSRSAPERPPRRDEPPEGRWDEPSRGRREEPPESRREEPPGDRRDEPSDRGRR